MMYNICMNNKSYKGKIPWNKGKKYTEEQKKKLNLEGLKIGWTQENREKYGFKKGHHINKGIIRSEEEKQKNKEWHLGRKQSEETKKRRSETLKRIGHKPALHYGENHPNWKGGMSICVCGKKLSAYTSKYCNLCIRKVNNGENHYNWKGGITPLNKKLRASLEYKLWRKSVFERDNFTCIWCGDNMGGNLHADHIQEFAYYPELRLAIDNGRTLCKSCHEKRHKL